MCAQNKEVSQIFVAHKDKFIRFGFEWYKNGSVNTAWK